MPNSSQLIPTGHVTGAEMPAFGLPLVVERPLALELVAIDTFGGLTGVPSPTSPRRVSGEDPPPYPPSTRSASAAPRAPALLGGFAVLCVHAPAPARADTVTDWDQIAAAALQSPGTATPPGAGQGAPSIAHLAMVHAAVYDAVNTIGGGREPYASSPAAERFYSQDAAVAAAAHHVLVNGGLGISAARMSDD